MNNQSDTSSRIQAVGTYTFTLEDVVTGETSVEVYKNIIPDVGLGLMAEYLTATTPSSSVLVNYAALGTGTATPISTDTRLQTETYRNAIASRTAVGTTAYCTAYFNQTEVTGTFKEAGIFSGATGTANSGVLISHVAINVTKTNTQKLTIDWSLTFTSA